MCVMSGSARLLHQLPFTQLYSNNTMLAPRMGKWHEVEYLFISEAYITYFPV